MGYDIIKMIYQIVRKTAKVSPWIAAGCIIAIWISRGGRGGRPPGSMHVMPTIREEDAFIADRSDIESMPIHRRKKQKLS